MRAAAGRLGWWSACGLLVVGPLALAGCSRPAGPALSFSENASLAMRAVLEAGGEAAAEGAAVMAQPTGWATLVGTFKVDGPPPSRSPLSVNRDVEVCAPGGRQILDETVVVGPDGGLRDVLLFVSTRIPGEDPAWVHPSYAEARLGEVIFDQKNCIFLTHVATMQATQTMRVLNSDPIGHNTNLSPTRGAMGGNFIVPAGGEERYRPGGASPAPFPVNCNIHPWMSAWLMVCDHPYFAVTAADGTFEIANIPAGVELEFRVWQEKVGAVQEVTVNGQSQSWSRGRFTLNLAPDERHEMQVTLGSALFR